MKHFSWFERSSNLNVISRKSAYLNQNIRFFKNTFVKFVSSVVEINILWSKINLLETKKATLSRRFYQVVPPGIEPGTQGFSVLCSTD